LLQAFGVPNSTTSPAADAEAVVRRSSITMQSRRHVALDALRSGVSLLRL
jgi:hypothetical protein